MATVEKSASATRPGKAIAKEAPVSTTKPKEEINSTQNTGEKKGN